MNIKTKTLSNEPKIYIMILVVVAWILLIWSNEPKIYIMILVVVAWILLIWFVRGKK